jgi:hypothetical protein
MNEDLGNKLVDESQPNNCHQGFSSQFLLRQANQWNFISYKRKTNNVIPKVGIEDKKE